MGLVSMVESVIGVDQMGIVVGKDGLNMNVMDPLEDQIIMHVLNRVILFLLKWSDLAVQLKKLAGWANN